MTLSKDGSRNQPQKDVSCQKMFECKDVRAKASKDGSRKMGHQKDVSSRKDDRVTKSFKGPSRRSLRWEHWIWVYKQRDATLFLPKITNSSSRPTTILCQVILQGQGIAPRGSGDCPKEMEFLSGHKGSAAKGVELWIKCILEQGWMMF